MTPTRRRPPDPPIPSPLRTFYACPFCGSSILLRLWQTNEGRGAGRWVHLAGPGKPALTPLGAVHHCVPQEEQP